MRYLLVFNDSPYGNQRTYNGLRLAVALVKASLKVNIFLLGDGVTAALDGFNPAHADYNPQEILKFVAEHGTEIGVCRTCLEARGIPDTALLTGATRSTIDQLVAWTEECEKVLVF